MRMVSLRDEAPTEDAPPLLAGRYQLEGMLGAGGMGAVYRARDLELEEVVALKILTHLDAQAITSFRAEVKLARRVTHRHVARTFDIGEHGGTRFLTMEYVGGGSLRRLLGQGGVDRARAIELARQITAGLAAVHAEGIVHGDLKPENVLVTGTGEAKVSDFGLAHLGESDDESSSPGTPAYMAPEQLAGSRASERADVYSLGIILCELLTGKRPWAGTRDEAIADRLVGRPPTIDRASLPEPVADVLARTLSFNAADRPSVEEVAAALSATSPLGKLVTRVRPTRPERGSIRVGVRTLVVENPADAYLGIAFASDMSRFLATAPELEVVQGPLEEVRAHDIDAAIEGTVRRSGLDVTIVLRLVSRDGFLLTGESVRASLTDVLVALEAAAQKLARALEARPQAKPSNALHDPQVLDMYLRARAGDYDGWHDTTSDNVEQYKAILARAPDDPVLLASYSLALGRTCFMELGRHKKALEIAAESIRRAPDLAEAHAALAAALVISHDMEGAVRAAVRALELSPSLSIAQSILGGTLLEIGELRHGHSRADLALAIDPRVGLIWSAAARTAAMTGDLARLRKLLAKTPSGRGPTVDWLPFLTKARIAFQLQGGAVEEAIAEIDRHPLAAMPPLSIIRMGLTGQIDVEITRATFQSIIRDPSLNRPNLIMFQTLAEIAMFQGKPDVAERAMLDAEATGHADITWMDHALVARLKGRPSYDQARERVAARAKRTREVAALTGIEAT